MCKKTCSVVMLLLLLETTAFSAELETTKQLTTIQEAYSASIGNLLSGIGTGTYEIYAAPAGKGSKLELKVKAIAKVYFDHGKFHIRLDYEKDDLHHLESCIIVHDGTAILVNRMSKIIHPSNSEGDVYEAKPSRPIMRKAGFDYDPCRLPASVLAVDYLQKRASGLTIKVDANMDYSGSYDLPPVVHCTFLASHKAGYNVIAYQEYNTNHNNFQHVERLAAWDRKDNIWFVKSIDDQWLSMDGSGERIVFQYTNFEPNVEVPSSLFKFDALALKPTARLIDRRPNTEDPVLRQPQPATVDTAKLDTLADTVKSLTPSSAPPSPRSKVARYLLLAMGLLFCVLGLLFIWRRRIRKANITSET